MQFRIPLADMPQPPSDPASKLESSILFLEEILADLKEQLAYLKQVQSQEPIAALVPVTTKRMSKHVIVDVIVRELPGFATPGSTYDVGAFRKHCQPFLPIGTADMELDCDDRAKWESRFNYSHNQIAELRGFIPDRRGGWTVPVDFR